MDTLLSLIIQSLEEQLLFSLAFYITASEYALSTKVPSPILHSDPKSRRNGPALYFIYATEHGRMLITSLYQPVWQHLPLLCSSTHSFRFSAHLSAVIMSILLYSHMMLGSDRSRTGFGFVLSLVGAELAFKLITVLRGTSHNRHLVPCTMTLSGNNKQILRNKLRHNCTCN